MQKAWSYLVNADIIILQIDVKIIIQTKTHKKSRMTVEEENIERVIITEIIRIANTFPT